MPYKLHNRVEYSIIIDDCERNQPTQDQLALIAKYCAHLPQLSWLGEQGYQYQVTSRYDFDRCCTVITMFYDLPESIMTFLALKWPSSVSTVEI